MDEQVSPQPEGASPDAGRAGDSMDGSAIISHSEGLIEASAAFDQQMEQMQRWKKQLAGQMDLLRKDGLKLLERQKKLSEERGQVAAERKQIETLKGELQTQIAAVKEQEGQLRQKLEEAGRDRIEAQQLEAQRAQARDDLRTAEGILEEIGRKQDELGQREHALKAKAAETEAREKGAVELEQRILVQQVQVREMTEQLEAQRRELLAASEKVEGQQRQAQQLEQELAEQMMVLAQQTKRMAERRGQTEGSATGAGEELRPQIDALTRERDTQEARIRHLVKELNETKAQASVLESESAQLSQQAKRAEELLREKQAAQQRAAALGVELEKASEEAMGLKGRVRELEEKQESPAAGAGDGALAGRIKELEQQLAKTSGQLKETLEFVDLQAAEAALAKSAREGDIREWQAKLETVEAEKKRLAQEMGAPRSGGEGSDGNGAGAQPEAGGKRWGHQRSQLVRHARTLRNKRKQTRELVVTLDVTRAELGKQLQQVRVRRDNLEQVKRLLEKQETIMARKLADHNAIKTVAAVGILLIMILGGVFVGVYRFVAPEYRGEALVQLAPPAEVPPDKVGGWLETEATSLKASAAAQQLAWAELRQDGYAMHDTKEGWVDSLAGDLTTQVDAGGKTIAVRIKGASANGVAQGSNALANAFAEVARQKSEKGMPAAAAAGIVGKATAPETPVRDPRLMLALGGAGILMLVALIAVFVVRKLISRQLKEIDKMADAKDLEDLNDDMPAETATA